MKTSNINLTKRQIVWLCRLYDPHIGGVERHVAELSHLLRNKGYSILVITEQYSENLPLEETKNGIRILRIPKNLCGKKFTTWFWMLQLLQRLPELKNAIWHTHDVHWWILPFVLIRRLSNVFVTFHGYEHTKKPSLREKFWRGLAQKFSKGSLMVGEWIAKWYGLKTDLITYGGACISSSPQKSHVQTVSLARLEEDTGVLILTRVVSEFPKIPLKIYGEGSQASNIRQLCHQHPNIRYFGASTNPSEILNSATHVFASQYLSIIEAMQAGRVVIAYSGTPLKHKYLDCFPGKKWLHIWSTEEELRAILRHPPVTNKLAQNWASKQTWESVLHLYFELWKR